MVLLPVIVNRQSAMSIKTDMANNVASNAAGNLTLIQAFLKILTWTKLFQLTMFFVIVGLAIALYETRSIFIEYTKHQRIGHYDSPPQVIGKTSKEEIDQIVTHSDLIVAIVVSTVDFQKNTRHIIYKSSDDRNLRKIYDDEDKKLTNDVPLFNNDTINNGRMVDLINGEFTCHLYNNSIDALLIPASIPYANTVCSNGIPPFYGMFSGVVSVITKRTPSATEVAQLREVLKNLASKIYERDIK